MNRRAQRWSWCRLACCALAALAAFAGAQSPVRDAFALEGGRARVIVELALDLLPEGRLTPSAVGDQRERIGALQDGVVSLLGDTVEVHRRFVTMAGMALSVDAIGLERLRRDPRVAAVREDRLSRPALLESVPLIGADDASAWGVDGSGWAVAVLDTGVDTTHPFFAGRTVAEACFSSNDAGMGASSACPNGQATQTGLGAAAPPAAIDGAEHGTHVAGIALGAGGAFAGVGRGADLVAVQVFSRFGAPICPGDPCLRSYESDLIAGLEYVYGLTDARDVAAVNISLAGGRYPEACGRLGIVETLVGAGVAVVAASGNDGFADALAWPACDLGVVAVGATGDGSGGYPADEVAPFSNASPLLDLLAPGASIRSSVPGGGYADLVGTSMAAPHVAGAWASVKQRWPAATVAEVRAMLAANGVAVTDARSGLQRPRIDLRFLEPVVPDGPDLAFDAPPSLRPAVPEAGDAVEVCVSWRNVGDAAAVSANGEPFVVVRGFLDADLAPEARFTPDATVGSGVPPSVGGVGCFAIPGADAVGPHTIYLHLDPDGAIAESDETNNRAALPFTTLARPANDDFAQRAVIAGDGGAVSARTGNATSEPGEPDHAGEEAHASLWWSWSAPSVTRVRLDAAGSDFATRLVVYRGVAVDDLTAVEVVAGGAGSVEFVAEAGVTYQIAIDGRDGATGQAWLRWSTEVLSCSVTAFDLRSLGDADGDGRVGPADALRILRIARGSWPMPSPGSDAFRHADLDADGVIDDADARLALLKIADPSRPPRLFAEPTALSLAVGESGCVRLANAGSGILPPVSIVADPGLAVVDVTPIGADGRAYAVARAGGGRGIVMFEAWDAGTVVVEVDRP